LDFIRVIPIALHSLSGNKIRSLLTALGVVFGVGAVIAMLSIGEGARREAAEQIELLGANNLYFENTWESWHEARTEGLVLGDGEALGSLDLFEAWAATRRYGDVEVQAGGRRVKAEVIAATPGYRDIVDLDVERGRFFDGQDHDRRRRVCVLGSSLKRAAFPFEGASGHRVKIDEDWFTVIGEAEYRKIGKSRLEGLALPEYNSQVFVPFSVAGDFESAGRRGVRPSESADEVIARVRRTSEVVPGAGVAGRMLSRLHWGEEDFRVVVPQALLAQSRRTQRTFSIVMGAIAGISLLVGGIGIMNIMLATVLERRHEIGVRRAAGATTRGVLFQFLIEAVILSLAGCLAGIGLGAALSFAVGQYAGWPTALSPLHVLLAVGVAGVVGVASGYYPAIRAAQIDPGEALRYE
jgi:putative ABC transport system permease protein